ncbi:MAG: xylulokinase [Rhodospirillales bacterium]|nr:xylulokinase [Rhodospirillales bacterium]
MFAGVDIGTSGVKIVLVDDDENVRASADYRLEVSRPHLHWQEQHPDDWWDGVVACFDNLQAKHADLLSRVRGIGLSGQMHGPVFIDKQDRPLRKTLLWNDGRAVDEAETLIRAVPDMGRRAGCRPNPGFAAPKILWLRKHEPEVLENTDCIFFPKDYVRLKLTGERATEPTDACGSHFMDVESGAWAEDLCAAVGVEADWLPPVLQAADAAGCLLDDLADRWGMPRNTVVAAGAGDNMAGAIGVGVGNPGDAVISVGTSGVMSIVDADYHPVPDKAVITHPHAVPGTYLSMGVVLSATSCLDWAAALTGKNAADLARAAERRWQDRRIEGAPVFLPYVNGIRSPHDMPEARGLMMGLDLGTDAAMIGWSVLEGVAFHIFEGFDAQREAGIHVRHLQFIGGGSRSRLWGEMISTLTGLRLDLPVGREVGASLGAARLARVAAGEGDLVGTLCRKPASEYRIEPTAELGQVLEKRFRRFRDLFARTADIL